MQNQEASCPRIEFNFESRLCRVNDQYIRLTTREHDLLSCFLREAGTPLTIAMISETMWGDCNHKKHVVDALVYHLNKKLGVMLIISTRDGWVAVDGELESDTQPCSVVVTSKRSKIIALPGLKLDPVAREYCVKGDEGLWRNISHQDCNVLASLMSHSEKYGDNVPMAVLVEESGGKSATSVANTIGYLRRRLRPDFIIERQSGNYRLIKSEGQQAGEVFLRN